MDSMENRSDVSVVGRGTRIEGTIASAGALRVEGEVVGAITAEGDVSLTPEARVEANIQAQSIALAGRVKGDLTVEGDVSLPPDSRLDGNIRAHNVAVGGVVNGKVAAERIELNPRAEVRGDLTTKSLAIAEGAVFNGRSNMGGDPQPDKRIATAAFDKRGGSRQDEPAAMTPHPA